MTEKDTCPICLLEYTSAGKHRIVSLKCGHLFGDQCIKLWFNKKKSALCPKCYKPCRRTELRRIFADRVDVTDMSREETLIEELAEEKRARLTLERENKRLGTMVCYLGQELSRCEEALECLKQRQMSSIHKRLCKKVKVGTHMNSILAYDEASSVLVYSLGENKTGIGIVDAKGTTQFIPLFGVQDGTIRDIKTSPYNDGMVCISHKNALKLLNMHKGREVADIRASASLWGVCFDPTDREVVFAGDEKGYLNMFYIDTSPALARKVFVARCPIHSLHKTREAVYCAGVLGLWKVRCDGWIAEKIEFAAYSVCTNLHGSSNSLVAVFRDSHMRTRHLVCGERDVVVHTSHTQVRRRRDKIYGDLLFSADDRQNMVLVYDINTCRVKHAYRPREKIIDFSSTAEGFYILADGHFYVFVQ